MRRFFCDLNIFSCQKQVFLKKIFRFFAWIFFDKLAVKADRSGVRMPGGCSKELPLFFDRSGVRMLGGIFCSKELPLFFDRSGVRIPGGFFVQRNCLCCLTDLGYVCRGEFLFKGIAFGFWDFFVQIQGNFSKEIFLFLRNFGFGVRIPGGKCLNHKKKRHEFVYQYWKNLVTLNE